MRLLSVNIGHPRENHWDEQVDSTGIDKHPVPGPIAVAAPGPKGTGAVGLAGDAVYDVNNHGGDDQAVYAYAREDYEYWQSRLSHPLRNGVFGENLTTHDVDVNGARIGERWRVGKDVLLEVSCPRIPCATFRGWMDRKGWLKMFTASKRCGAYLRVIEPGYIEAGDPVVVESRPDHDVTISVTFAAMTTERELLPELLNAPALPEEIRQTAQKYVANNSRGN